LHQPSKSLQKNTGRCLEDWENDALPWTEVKQQIVAFIQLNCKTKECSMEPKYQPRQLLNFFINTSNK
jgi:hypothetical protein